MEASRVAKRALNSAVFIATMTAAQLFTTHIASAARTSIIPQISPSRSRNGESVNFQIHVQHEGSDPISAPRIPPLEDWEILNSYQSLSNPVIILNGKMLYRQIADFTYVLRPLKTGKLKIPKATVQVGTTAYDTDPLEVQVDALPNQQNARPRIQQFAQNQQQAPGNPLANDDSNTDENGNPTANPGGDDDEDGLNALAQQRAGGSAQQPAQENFKVPEQQSFFLRAEPSATTVYQGELITLSYNLYQREVPLRNLEFSKFPDFKGFLKEELYLPKNPIGRPVILNGRSYHKSELIRYALFPLKSGAIDVGPMVIKADMIMSALDQADIFNSLLNGQIPNIGAGIRSIPQSKSSQSIKVIAKPLPAAPAGVQFTGGVGQYQISLKGPEGKLEVDQPFTVTLTIAGSGNVKAIAEPQFKLPSSVEPYQTKNSYEFHEDATGYKSFEYLFLPRATGKVTLPALEWTYFNPKTAQYVTLKTDALELNIEGSSGVHNNPLAEGRGAPAPVAPSFSPPRVGQQNWVRLTELNGDSFLVNRLFLGLQAVLYAFYGTLLFRRKNSFSQREFYKKYPWEKTAARIRAHNKWSAPELAILVDQWSRERLHGLVVEHDPSTLLHAQSSRDEFLEALSVVLSPEKQRSVSDLKKLWSDLDIMRFTGSKVSRFGDESGNLLKRAEEIIERLRKNHIA